ncbi:NUDIX domain-containing protein [Flaviaesturariibacter flavus]|uniref:NUDIX domain-containing protein n=1 Tax=Flaviaesturariibacter flavus TaxID=2502780 RepID=A0A4R1BJG8_9BACT|nr:NUDIX domain-containing protein [Flaviaesturariibacter flavus]TCJ17451.1 NUDIX domain-containing protein [Flaviaesturariibacter flavus]
MALFNIRVYGLLVNEQREVLVTDEWIRGMKITKFPGGGLEFGEGTRDCLRREFLEEMNLKVEVGAHLYTTDFYQQSAFNPEHQIVSIYYIVKALEPISVRISTQPFDFDDAQRARYKEERECESFRFIPWEQFSEDSVHLPIDKVAARIFKEMR